MILPEDFIRETRLVMGEERFNRFMGAFDEEAPVSIRINPKFLRKEERGKWKEICSKVPWCAEGYYLSGRPQFTFDPLFHAGCYYVQEAASMFVCHILNWWKAFHFPQVTVLDMCAAPGGKSTAIRTVLPEGSTLVSNEPIPNRAQILLENITKWGWPDCIVTNNYPRDFRKAKARFDIILCDDGFEDSRFTGVRYICLDWQEPPTSWKSLLPAGPFRSLKQDHDENKIVHLRCFDSKSQAPDVRFYIKSITNYVPGTPLSATIICGLGSPKRFIDDVHAFTKSTEKAACIHIEKTIIRPDHDKNFAQVVQNELSRGNDIIISQKDACRLPQTILAHPQVHIAIQEIEVSDKILKELPL